MPPRLLLGLRVLGVAGGAALLTAVSFYIWLAIAIGGRRTISPDVYAGILYGTMAVGGTATISAITSRHRLTLTLLGLDGALILSSMILTQVDGVLEPQRRQADNLAYQERIIRQLSTGRLVCADGYEVHRMTQGQLALVYFQVGQRESPVQFLATKTLQDETCQLYESEFLLDIDRDLLATCVGAADERLEDWLAALRAAPCPEF